MLELVFATHNLHKLIEIHALLKPGIQLISLDALGYHNEIEENGIDLHANAQIKALHVYGLFNKNCFADDSGLEVDALNRLPGVHSARFAGAHKNNLDNIQLLLERMQNKSNRKAKFRTIICLIMHGSQHFFEGEIQGQITHNMRGNHGFGYDSVFIPDGYQHTFAEMDATLKNSISHRSIAFGKLITFLNNFQPSIA